MRLALLGGGPMLHALAGRLTTHGIELVDEGADLALAGDWESVPRLAEVSAARVARLVDDLADRLVAPDGPRHAAAAAVEELPLPAIVTARWLAELWAALHPDVACEHVRPGAGIPAVDAPAEADGPLRILAVAAPDPAITGQLAEPHTVTVLGERGAHGGASTADDVARAQARAAAFAQADVLLDLSSHEHHPGPAVAAARHGLALVAVAAPGREEVLAHGVTGLEVAWDDARGTARALDLLARDRALLRRLREGALDAGRAWPTPPAGLAALAEAVQRLDGALLTPELRAQLKAAGEASPAGGFAAQSAGAAEAAEEAVAPAGGLWARPRLRGLRETLGR